MAWTQIPIKSDTKEMLKEAKGSDSYDTFIVKLRYGKVDSNYDFLISENEKRKNEQSALAKRLLKLEEIAHGYQ
ncbi:MAG: hypothetical protein ACTSPI_17245 [Candidatus Heimdallarchaeaceae archaeon]